MWLNLSEKKEKLLRQSYEAFSLDLLMRSLHTERKVDALNGMVISEMTQMIFT